ncbi:MAG TPA: hypothetical protein VG738_19930 [Chitinophagaceae bacterium]|nr:hypothetical protein [Chitinophagaceae bacterium]
MSSAVQHKRATQPGWDSITGACTKTVFTPIYVVVAERRVDKHELVYLCRP